VSQMELVRVRPIMRHQQPAGEPLFQRMKLRTGSGLLPPPDSCNWRSASAARRSLPLGNTRTESVPRARRSLPKTRGEHARSPREGVRDPFEATPRSGRFWRGRSAWTARNSPAAPGDPPCGGWRGRRIECERERDRVRTSVRVPRPYRRYPMRLAVSRAWQLMRRRSARRPACIGSAYFGAVRSFWSSCQAVSCFSASSLLIP